MNPSLLQPELRQLLAVARSRLRLGALFSGLAPGLWLAATMLAGLTLLAIVPQWLLTALAGAGLVLGSMTIALLRAPPVSSRAAVAADYWLQGRGLITTAADILARQPLNLQPAEIRVLDQAQQRAPQWTSQLRQQTRPNPGARDAVPLLALLLATFLLSLQDPVTPGRANPGRANPGRIALALNPIVAGGQSAANQALRPDAAQSSNNAADAGTDNPIRLASERAAAAPANNQGSGLVEPTLPITHSTPTAGNRDHNSATTAAATSQAAPVGGSVTTTSWSSIQRRGPATASTAAGSADSDPNTATASAPRAANVAIEFAPVYRQTFSGSSAALVRRFFALQEISDE